MALERRLAAAQSVASPVTRPQLVAAERLSAAPERRLSSQVEAVEQPVTWRLEAALESVELRARQHRPAHREALLGLQPSAARVARLVQPA